MHNAFAQVAVPTAAATQSPLLPTGPDLLWGGIVFVIVLVFFIWKGVPRLNAALDARAEAIEGSLRRAEEAQAGAQEALEKYNSQLVEARAEAAAIRDEAREAAKQIRTELIAQAQADADRVVASARAQIEVERAAALQSLRTEVGSLALGLASSVVGESLDSDKRSKDIVDRFIVDLEAFEAAKSGA
jgi:F-type H+-transporting ATPase subunit b